MSQLFKLSYDQPLALKVTRPSNALRPGSLGRSRSVPHPYLELTEPYQAGDPIKAIDWRYYGRKNELVVRKIKEPKSLVTEILCDLSNSMHWPADKVRAAHQLTEPDKAHVAVRVALHISYNMIQISEPVRVIFLLEMPSSTQPLTHAKELTFGNLRTIEDCYHSLFTPASLSLAPNETLASLLDDFVKTTYIIHHPSDLADILCHRRSLLISDFISQISHTITTHHPNIYGFHLLSELEKTPYWTKASALYSDDLKRHSSGKLYSRRSLLPGFQRRREQWQRKVASRCSYHHVFFASDSLETYCEKLSEMLV